MREGKGKLKPPLFEKNACVSARHASCQAGNSGVKKCMCVVCIHKKDVCMYVRACSHKLPDDGRGGSHTHSRVQLAGTHTHAREHCLGTDASP